MNIALEKNIIKPKRSHLTGKFIEPNWFVKYGRYLKEHTWSNIIVYRPYKVKLTEYNAERLFKRLVDNKALEIKIEDRVKLGFMTYGIINQAELLTYINPADNELWDIIIPGYDYKIIKNESVVFWHKKSEIARNRVGEQLGSYFNKLYVAIVLYPLMPMLIFATGFVVRYNYYAFKKGFGMQFLNKLSRDYFTTIKKGLKARQPVSLNAYYKVKEFKI